MRALCVADNHFGKGHRYGRVPGERLAEQEANFRTVLELAREHHVDVVLHAGDLMDRRTPTPHELLAAERPLVEHEAAGGARVVMVNGNHCVSGTDESCAVQVFAEAGLIELHRRAGLTTIGDTSIAFLPWAPVSRIVAAEGGGDRDDVNQVAAELLLETARGLRAAQQTGPMILLTHFSISGASTPDGMDVSLFREPVLDLGDLEAIGFDAVIAGHIHKGQYLDAEERILYVGSPMPLDFGEAKCEHGCWIVDFDGDSMTTEFVPIDSRPFLTIDGTTDDDTWHPAEEVAGAFVKIRLHATEEQARHYDVAGLRSALFDDLGAHNVWVESTIVRELRARVAGIDETVSDTDALELWLSSQAVNGDQAPALRLLHTDYLAEVRA